MSRDDQAANRSRKRMQKTARARPADLNKIFLISVNQQFERSEMEVRIARAGVYLIDWGQ